MEVNRLLDSELSYEIFIRGYPVEGTVEQKRAILRKLFLSEREGASLAPSIVNLDADEELAICSSKVTDFEREIRHFNFENRKNEFQRLYTRLLHVRLRLGRISLANQNQNKLRDRLVSKVRNLIGDLNLAYDGVTFGEVSQPNVSSRSENDQAQISILDTPNPLIPEIVYSNASTNPTPDCQNEQPAHTRATNLPRTNHRSTDLLIPELAVEQECGDNHLSLADKFTQAQQSLIASSRQVYDGPSCSRATNERPARVVANPTVSALMHSTLRQEGALDGQRFSVDHPELHSSGGNKFASRVRFADDEQNNRPRGEEWSRVPNEEHFSHLNDSLPFGNSESRIRRLADLHLSPGTRENSVPSYYRTFDEQPRYADPGRWNLKYDGVSSVNNFLQRIEELRISRGVSKQQLLRSAAELFTRDALLWYRTNQFSSWDDLVSQLRDAFQPYDYENGIWEELRRRTQGAHERVVVFVASMEQLFNRLSQKPSEETRLKLIRRNLLPYIQTQLALHPVHTMRELTQACRAIEEIDIRVRQFCPPPTNYRQLLEPELAYRKPTGAPSTNVSVVSPDNPTSSQPTNTTLVQAADVSSSSTNNTLCWNCRSTTHKFKKCDQPRRIFCFKCGYDNVMARNCPRCTKNSRPGRQ